MAYIRKTPYVRKPLRSRMMEMAQRFMKRKPYTGRGSNRMGDDEKNFDLQKRKMAPWVLQRIIKMEPLAEKREKLLQLMKSVLSHTLIEDTWKYDFTPDEKKLLHEIGRPTIQRMLSIVHEESEPYHSINDLNEHTILLSCVDVQTFLDRCTQALEKMKYKPFH
jgi:hypothetical protein